jgi:hypothetical protein
MELTNEQIKGILEQIAENYLPEGKQNIANVFTYPNKHGIIHDLESMGKSYDFSTQEDVIQAARDAFEWNLFLLEKNHQITQEEITVDSQEAFLLTTILGHKGAIPYLKGKEINIEKINDIREVIASDNDEVPREEIIEQDEIVDNSRVLEQNNPSALQGNEPKEIDYTIPLATSINPLRLSSEDELPLAPIPDLSNAAINREQNFIASTDENINPAEVLPEDNITSYDNLLGEVVVSARRSEVILESGRDEATINAEGQQIINQEFEERGDLSNREALRIVDRVVGKDDVALRVNEADTGILIGSVIHNHGLSAIQPAIWLEQTSSDYSILKDKYGDKGEVQLKTPAGDFGLGERFILAYFAENMQYPVDDEIDEMKIAGFSEDPINNPYRMIIQPTREAVLRYLPELEESEITTLTTEPTLVRMSSGFNPDVYDYWKDWAREEAKISDRQVEFTVHDRSVSMVASQKLYEGFNGSLDLEYVNTRLGEYENVSIQEYQRDIIRQNIESRQSFANLTAFQNAIENRAEIGEDNFNLISQGYFEAVVTANQAKENTESRIDFFKDLRRNYDGKNKSEVRGLLKNLIRLEEVELASNEVDLAIVDRDNSDDEIRLAESYLRKKQRTDKIIFDISSYERAEMLESAESLLGQLEGEQKTLLEDILNKHQAYFSASDENELSQILYAMDSGLAEEDKEKANTSISASGAYYQNNEEDGANINLGMRHQSYTEIPDDFSLELDADLQAGLLTDASGDNEFIQPLSQNPIDFTQRQNLDLGLNYQYTPFNVLSADAYFKTNAGVRSREFEVANSFGDLRGGNFSAGIRLPSQYQFANGEINTSIGGIIEKEGKIFLTGDHLEYSINTSLSSANYEATDPILSLENTTFLTSGLNLRYSNGRFNFLAGAEYQSLSPFNKEGFDNISTNFLANRSFGNLSVGVLNQNFFSDEFTMNNFGLNSSITGQKLSHQIEAGVTRLRMHFPQASDSEIMNIFNAGYKLGVNAKEGSILDDTEFSLDLNFSNNPSLPIQPVELRITKKF